MLFLVCDTINIFVNNFVRIIVWITLYAGLGDFYLMKLNEVKNELFKRFVTLELLNKKFDEFFISAIIKYT